MYRINITDRHQHRRFLLQSSNQALSDLMICIEQRGASIGISPPQDNERLPLLWVPETKQTKTMPQDKLSPWLVWNRNDLDHIQEQAQDQGALCVLPPRLSFTALLNALQTADLVASARNPNTHASLSLKRHFEKGQPIHLEEDRVLHIRRGVVRCSSFHPDGSEVVIGFHGEGDVLMAHAAYGCHSHSCHVEMRAHTPLSATIEPWVMAVNKADFYERLKQRICQMELWSSMQARPTMEGRLLGILQVIGGRFARKTDEGTLLDIKLTHEQLAGAIGATRTTVTRLLGTLRKKGLLQTVKTPVGELLMLRDELEHCYH